MSADKRLISNRTDWLGWLGLALAAGIVAVFALGWLTNFDALQQFSMWVLAGFCFAFGAIRVVPPRISELMSYVGYICIFAIIFSIVFRLLPIAAPWHLPDPVKIIETYDFRPLWDAVGL